MSFRQLGFSGQASVLGGLGAVWELYDLRPSIKVPVPGLGLEALQKRNIYRLYRITTRIRSNIYTLYRITTRIRSLKR